MTSPIKLRSFIFGLNCRCGDILLTEAVVIRETDYYLAKQRALRLAKMVGGELSS